MARYAIPEWNKKAFFKKIFQKNKAGYNIEAKEVSQDVFNFEGHDFVCTIYDINSEVDFSKLSVDGVQDLPLYYNNYYGYNTESIIALAIYSIRRYGFKSSKEENSTKVHVVNSYNSPEIIEKFKNSPDYKDFMCWVDTQKGESDFEKSALEAIKEKYVRPFSIGYICAYINNYLKKKDIEFIKENPNLDFSLLIDNIPYNSNYIAPVGSNIEVEVISSKVLHVNGAYAYNSIPTCINRLIDKDGHVIIWSTSQTVPEHCYIRAKVKAHKEYNGINETVITKGKIYAC